MKLNFEVIVNAFIPIWTVEEKGQIIAELDFNKVDVDLNIPPVNAYKEGPSAGAAIALSLLVSFLNYSHTTILKKKNPSVDTNIVQLKSTILVSGEINLCGDLLKIGNLKQKYNIVANNFTNISTLIFPMANSNIEEENFSREPRPRGACMGAGRRAACACLPICPRSGWFTRRSGAAAGA